MQIVRTGDTLTAPTSPVIVFVYKHFSLVHFYLPLSIIIVVVFTKFENNFSFLNVNFPASVVCAKSVSSF